MTVKEAAFKLEELQVKAWMLNSLTLAVKDAIIEEPNDARNLEGAFYRVHSQTEKILKKP